MDCSTTDQGIRNYFGYLDAKPMCCGPSTYSSNDPNKWLNTEPSLDALRISPGCEVVMRGSNGEEVRHHTQRGNAWPRGGISLLLPCPTRAPARTELYNAPHVDGVGRASCVQTCRGDRATPTTELEVDARWHHYLSGAGVGRRPIVPPQVPCKLRAKEWGAQLGR